MLCLPPPSQFIPAENQCIRLYDTLEHNVLHRLTDDKQQLDLSPVNVVPCFKLRNGVEMPVIGLGTSHSGGYCHETVVFALKHCGYRLIDTAKRYGCETMLCEAIKESQVNRSELFLSSKLWPRDYGFHNTNAALNGSLERLGTDYLDMMMLHWPEVPSEFVANKWSVLEETWRSLELAYDDGICRAIAVSNFNSDHLDKLLDISSIAPHVNQIEFHPYQNPLALRECCDSARIQIQGYCPLGKGNILDCEPVTRVANSIGRSAAQVLIRWSIESGVATIPKSTRTQRVLENISVFDFQLTQADMNLLNGLHDGRRYVYYKSIQQKIDSEMPDGYKLHLKRNKSSGS